MNASVTALGDQPRRAKTQVARGEIFRMYRRPKRCSSFTRSTTQRGWPSDFTWLMLGRVMFLRSVPAAGLGSLQNMLGPLGGQAGLSRVPQIPAELTDHPDRLRWNERYRAAGYVPSFAPHPMAVQALSMPLPAGPVLDLASGPSGSALLAAATGRLVTAVDASDVALGLLAQEARRRHLDGLITARAGRSWRAGGRTRLGYSLVLCTGFWDRAAFAAAAEAVRPGGMIGWEALTEAARRDRPRLPLEWCAGPGEPAALLPAGFEVISQDDVRPTRAEPPGAGSACPGYRSQAHAAIALPTARATGGGKALPTWR